MYNQQLSAGYKKFYVAYSKPNFFLIVHSHEGNTIKVFKIPMA